MSGSVSVVPGALDDLPDQIHQRFGAVLRFVSTKCKVELLNVRT